MHVIIKQVKLFSLSLLHLLTTNMYHSLRKCNTLLHSIFRIKKENILFFRRSMQPNPAISVYVGRSISICKDANRIFNLKKGTPLNFQYYLLPRSYRACAKIYVKSKGRTFFGYQRLQ